MGAHWGIHAIVVGALGLAAAATWVRTDVQQPAVVSSSAKLAWRVAGCARYMTLSTPRCEARGPDGVQLCVKADRYALLDGSLDGEALANWRRDEDEWCLTVPALGRLELREGTEHWQLTLDLVEDLVPSSEAPVPGPGAFRAEEGQARLWDVVKNQMGLGPRERERWLAAAEEVFLDAGFGFEATVAREVRMVSLRKSGRVDEARRTALSLPPETPVWEARLWLDYHRLIALDRGGRSREALDLGMTILPSAEKAQDLRLLASIYGELLAIALRSLSADRAAVFAEALQRTASRLEGPVRGEALASLGWSAFVAVEAFPERKDFPLVPERLIRDGLASLKPGTSAEQTSLVNLGLDAARRGDLATVEEALQRLEGAPLGDMEAWRRLLMAHRAAMKGADLRRDSGDSARQALEPLLEGQHGERLTYRAGLLLGRHLASAGHLRPALAQLEIAQGAAEALVADGSGLLALHLAEAHQAPARLAVAQLLASNRPKEAFAWARRGRRMTHPRSPTADEPSGPVEAVGWLLVHASDDGAHVDAFLASSDNLTVRSLPRDGRSTELVEAALDGWGALDELKALYLLPTRVIEGVRPARIRAPTTGRALVESVAVAFKLDLPSVPPPQGERTPLLIVDPEEVPAAARSVAAWSRFARWPSGTSDPDAFSLEEVLSGTDELIFVGHGEPSLIHDEARLSLPGGGWFDATRIETLEAPPQSAILIACHSGGRSQALGFGMGQALLYAGTREVAVSQQLIRTEEAAQWLTLLGPGGGPLVERWRRATHRLLRSPTPELADRLEVWIR